MTKTSAVIASSRPILNSVYIEQAQVSALPPFPQFALAQISIAAQLRPAASVENRFDRPGAIQPQGTVFETTR